MTGVEAASRLAICEGLLLTLTDEGAAKLWKQAAYRNAQVMLDGVKQRDAKDWDGRTQTIKQTVERIEGDAAQCREAMTDEELAAYREIAEAPVQAPGTVPARVPARKPQPNAQVKGRTGDKVRDRQFEKEHPRSAKGRVGGGEFAVKQGDGMQGQPDPQVRNLQQRLAQVGIDIAVDGRYGPATVEAVRQFQKQHGLKPDGFVAGKTQFALRHPEAGTEADTAVASDGEYGDNAPSVKELQKELDPQAAKQEAKAKAESGGSSSSGSSDDSASSDADTGSSDSSSSTDGESGDGSGDSSGESKAGSVEQGQQALDDLGYNLGEAGVDGELGPRTEAAIKAFQRKHGLKVTGSLNKGTLSALEKAANEKKAEKRSTKSARTEKRKAAKDPKKREVKTQLYDYDFDKRTGKGGKATVTATARGKVTQEAASEEAKSAFGSVAEQLRQATATRIQAAVDGDTDAFTRSRAREQALRRKLDEGLLRHLVTGSVDFDPNEHPRDRRGRFIDVLEKLPVGGEVKLPHNVKVAKRTGGRYEVIGKGAAPDVPSVSIEDRAQVAANDAIRRAGGGHWTDEQRQNVGDNFRHLVNGLPRGKDGTEHGVHVHHRRGGGYELTWTTKDGKKHHHVALTAGRAATAGLLAADLADDTSGIMSLFGLLASGEAEVPTIEEGLLGKGRGGDALKFNPKLHPRNRTGKFREVLDGMQEGQEVKLPGGTSVKRTDKGFEVRKGKSIGGGEAVRHTDADKAVKVALDKDVDAKDAEPDWNKRVSKSTRQLVNDLGEYGLGATVSSRAFTSKIDHWLHTAEGAHDSLDHLSQAPEEFNHMAHEYPHMIEELAHTVAELWGNGIPGITGADDDQAEPDLEEFKFSPHLHPRDRQGQFIETLGKLQVGKAASYDRNIQVERTDSGYNVLSRGRDTPEFVGTTPTGAAHAAIRGAGGKPLMDLGAPEVDDAWRSKVRSAFRRLSVKLEDGEEVKVGRMSIKRIGDEVEVTGPDALRDEKRRGKLNKLANVVEDHPAARDWLYSAGAVVGIAVLFAAAEGPHLDTDLDKRLEEAVQARKEAKENGDTAAFGVARARETFLRRRRDERLLSRSG